MHALAKAIAPSVTQESVVFGFTCLMFVSFALALPGFIAPDNLVSIVRSVSILGVLSLAMAIVVIGRGIDLSLVATMVVAVGWALVLASSNMPLWLSLLVGAVFALGVGLVIGYLVAYLEIPAIFTTLAMGSIVYGIGRLWFLELDVQNAPTDVAWFDFLGKGELLGIPTPVTVFASIAIILLFVLTRTSFGRFVYAVGDNPEAASISGVPVRSVRLAQFVTCALVAYLAGIIMASAVSGMNTRIYNSTIIYDVLLVVAVGGISLSGGRGGVRNVIVGTLFVGVLLNGMTIYNVGFTEQNLVKSVLLLAAIVFNTIVNPRDEQTGQQGDI